jgi:hypothetical protein
LQDYSRLTGSRSARCPASDPSTCFSAQCAKLPLPFQPSRVRAGPCTRGSFSTSRPSCKTVPPAVKLTFPLIPPPLQHVLAAGSMPVSLCTCLVCRPCCQAVRSALPYLAAAAAPRVHRAGPVTVAWWRFAAILAQVCSEPPQYVPYCNEAGEIRLRRSPNFQFCTLPHITATISIGILQNFREE